ncbi:linalool dehydratase-isomerase precursor [Colletotrichum kahawae]|uniref:Linalool dehydratase-isomerase n=1 Tax=Colletotrichum kahawae TaxID=34407 RepID=A0AAD9XYM7_COLKA|nr:linalool dehydratase-isomerase precursor [Colletotrichum kahawae]
MATATVTCAAEHPPNLPKTLPADFIERFPKISREQAGHLRHFHNLAAQKDGEWKHMGSQEPGQEWLDGYRYQLATMAYAAGAAHYHHLPALRSTFKSLLEKLIHKMLLRDVWGYWFLTSHSGIMVDPDIKELRKPWADPVYSGHLLLMVSLHEMLFHEGRFDEEDSIAFNWNPIFWGMGPERFCYTRKSLQEAILREMERENWLGVCCEPNSIFVVCNQFPLIALRYNDVRDKVDLSPGVLEKYQAAWKAKGMISDNGLIVDWYSPKQNRTKAPSDISFTSWALAFMNSWNPAFARRTSKDLATGYLAKSTEGHVFVPEPEVSFRMRELVASERVDPMDPATFTRAAKAIAEQNLPASKFPFTKPHFAYAAMWASELGEPEHLDGLLAYADAKMGPTWEDGGLFYGSSGGSEGASSVDVISGNAAVAYARFNVVDGQRTMYEKPWGEEHFATAPFVKNVDLASGVDFLRGSWD